MENEFRGQEMALMEQPQPTSRLRRILSTVDIFSFLPVPKGDQISTNRSICGSILIFVLFLAYVGYSLWEFFAHNIPTTNQYYIPLPDSLTTNAPSFAFAFMTGENLNETVHNKSYFDFEIDQVTIYKDPNIPRNYTKVSHHKCNSSEITWVNSSLSQFLLCPKSAMNLQGLLYSSEVHQYARLVFILCNYSDPAAGCVSQAEIEDLIAKGRVFFFLQKPSDQDYSTGTVYDGGFYLKYYFAVPGLYDRAELQIQRQEVYEYPDWLTSFSTKFSSSLSLQNEQFYVSKTPNPLLVFQVWLRLDANISKSEIKYLTIIDYISKWGALWGVFFTIGALYFLRYNKSRFYNRNPEWDEFEQQIAAIRSMQGRVRNPSELLRSRRDLEAGNRVNPT